MFAMALLMASQRNPHAAGRAHHHVGELDDADAGQGQGFVYVHFCH